MKWNFFSQLSSSSSSRSLSYISRKRNKWDVENCKDENAFKNILIRPFTKKMWWIIDFMRGHSLLTSSQGHIWEKFGLFFHLYLLSKLILEGSVNFGSYFTSNIRGEFSTFEMGFEYFFIHFEFLGEI